MLVNKEEFEKAFSDLDKNIRGLINTANYAHDMTIVNEMYGFSEKIGKHLNYIKGYVNQMEIYTDEVKKELEKRKRKPRIKQAVARSHPNGDRNYLEQYLNEGYHIIMANHIGEHGSIEYVLEKEVMEDVH